VKYNFAGASPLPFIAGGAITANSMVKVDTTAGQVVACTAITDAAIGVCLDGAAASGEQVLVQIFGVAEVRAGATITAGQELMVKNSGTGELDVAAGATARSVGWALQGGASGDTIAVLLAGPAPKAPPNS